MAASFEVEPPPQPAPRKSVFQSSDRMRSLHRASVTASMAIRDDTFAQALKAEAEEFGEEVVPKITSFEAIANFVIGCIGAGIVVFPKVMADNGLGLALCLISLSAFVTFESGQLMISSCDMAEMCIGARRGKVANYEDLAGAAFGTAGTTALAITKNSYALGALFVYTVLLTEGIQTLLKIVNLDLGEAVVRWAIVLPFVLALSMISNLKQLAKVSPLGTVGMCAQCLAICVGSIAAHWIDLGELEIARQNGWSLFNFDPFVAGSAISVFVFGFDGVVNLCCIRGQMSNPDELPSALRTCFIIVASFCAMVMCCGYFGFGAVTDENVITGMNDFCHGFACIFSSIASLGVTVNLLISYPLIFFTVISFFESKVNGSLGIAMHPVNMAFRAAMGLSLLLLGSLFSSPKDVISLVSAIFGSCLSIFFPMMIFYKLRQKSRGLGHKVEDVSTLRKVVHVIALLTGAAAMVFGFMQEISKFGAKKDDGESATTTTAAIPAFMM